MQLWYGAGVRAIEGAFQEHTESWLIAKCYRDTLPMLLGVECGSTKMRRELGPPRVGRRVWPWSSEAVKQRSSEASSDGGSGEKRHGRARPTWYRKSLASTGGDLLAGADVW